MVYEIIPSNIKDLALLLASSFNVYNKTTTEGGRGNKLRSWCHCTALVMKNNVPPVSYIHSLGWLSSPATSTSLDVDWTIQLLPPPPINESLSNLLTRSKKLDSITTDRRCCTHFSFFHRRISKKLLFNCKWRLTTCSHPGCLCRCAGIYPSNRLLLSWAVSREPWWIVIKHGWCDNASGG